MTYLPKREIQGNFLSTRKNKTEKSSTEKNVHNSKNYNLAKNM